MRAPLSWIRDFTPADAPVPDLVAALNQLGLEVDTVEEPGREIIGVRVARILDVVAHPNADKLQLADVDYGDGTTRVVCGAPNIHPGMLVPFAPSGAELPGGFRLERRTIRGETSDGMLCSPRELGLSDDHGGILDLGAGTTGGGGAAPPLGADVREVLGLDDVIFDLAITPNRPDAMCIVGVARELAAHFGWPLTVPDPQVPADPSATRAFSLVIEAPDRCPRYLGRVAAVTLGPSPDWMRQRLVKAGVRSINNVVDVTNYVLLECNQPLHAFDLDRLAGPGIVVREAEAGESITTLDGVERELDAADLLICDAERTPQAVAGIMGSSTSEISDATTTILLEAAYFERMGIARTSKRLKLRSESSARFERGIDPDGVERHAARAMELLVQLADARVAPDLRDEHPRPHIRPHITVRTSKVNGVLGTALSDGQIIDALAPLGLDVTPADAPSTFVAVPPSFRPDLEREIDLVEEVARRIGFTAIGRTVARPRDQVGGLTRSQRELRLVADTLVGAGLSEAITLPLVAPDDLRLLGLDAGAVDVANPLRAEESQLRTSLLPGLVRVVHTNRARGNGDVALFETGRVFSRPAPGTLLPIERRYVGAVLAGTVVRRPVDADRPVDVYDAVDVCRAVLDALGVADACFESAARPGFHPGRAVAVVVGSDGAERIEVGTVGEFGPAELEAHGLSAPVVAFELDLDALGAAPRRDRRFTALSPYPPSAIDLAFVLPEEVAAAAVVRTIGVAAGEVAERVRCFDEFRSDQIGAGRRSLAFSVVFRHPERTLTDQDVAALRAACIEAVRRDHGGELRA
jgi:phenylalanyl-tRNA synthetase beta chain